MSELLTAAQMRAIEQAAIESGEVTGLELMERAGQGVVEAVFEEWPELAPAGWAERGPAPAPPEYFRQDEGERRAVVLCGPGNNGGDGFVVARLLKGWGWEVEVFLYGDPDKLPPDARVNYERWCEMGEVLALTDAVMDGYAEDHPGTRLAVDALFGTGLTRPFHDLFRTQMELNIWQASCESDDMPRVVAIDIPSGICADSGRYLGWEQENPFESAIMANLTVTFHAEKRGHRLAEGPVGCGKLVVKDIGLEGSDRPRGGEKRPPEGAVGRCPAVPPGDRVWLAESPSGLSKDSANHKFSHGHALILSGPSGKGGAARLAARGALRVGAGVVTLGVSHEALIENAAQVNAIMLAEIDGADALARVLEDTRINALVLGPGLGVERARDFLKELFAGRAAARVAPARPTGGRELRPPRAGAPLSLVLDADALTALAQNAALFAALPEACVLTPHAGEFARLFPDIATKLAAPATKGPAYSKVDATRAAAARAGCVVLYKGPDTVIAHPDGRASVNSAAYERAAPWLATAGAGDVLAGMIAGLLARGFDPLAAAETAAWLHVEAALSFGPGLIAEDLPEELPKVFRALGL